MTMFKKISRTDTKKYVYSALAALICFIAVACLLILQPQFLKRLDMVIYDHFVARMGKGVHSEVPIMIDIDEKSLAEFGQWPWPRYRLAELLLRLCNSGVAAVGVDVLMPEPDRTSPTLWMSQFRKDWAEFNLNPEITGIPDELKDNDDYLASVLAELPVVLAAQFDNSAAGVQDVIKSLPVIVRRLPGAPMIADVLPSNTGIITPLPKLMKAARAVGVINAEGDEDGLCRRIPLLGVINGNLVGSLAINTLAVAAGNAKIIVTLSEDGLESIKTAGIDVPVSWDGTMLLAFRGASMYPKYSAADILKDAVPQEKINGRIAFLGSTAMGLKDIRPTPFDKNYPGLEMHAAAVDMILSKRFIHRPILSFGQEFLLAFLVCILSFFSFNLRSPSLSLICGVVLTVAVWFGHEAFMVKDGLYLTPIYSILLIILTAFSSFTLRFFLEAKDKKLLRKAFSNYVSPDIVEKIVRSGSVSSLKGEYREITVLFTDLRGFTALTENMPPTQVVEMLNRYFTPLTAIVRSSMGTVDKFIGDAMMAFWNAPMDVSGHTVKAVKALVDMLDALTVLNIELESEFGAKLRMGGGLHTGFAHIGNMGTAELRAYTAIGDTVNTASRLEGMCSKYGVEIVVSSEVARLCSGHFEVRPLDVVMLKGRTESTEIFSVMTSSEAEKRKDELFRWQRAFEHYRFGSFDEAMDICSGLATEFPGEKLYAIFKDRIEKLLKYLPEDWDGVFRYDSK